MPPDVPRFLLTGSPGAGKTTLVRRLAERLRNEGIAARGFVTQEIRERGQRVGFAIEEIGGEAAVMAHSAWDTGPRVGRYRVDVAAFERIALPAMTRAVEQGGVVIVDELGRMELCSDAFIRAAQQLFERDTAVVATVQSKAHPVTDALKRRAGVELLNVTRDAQDEVLARLAARLLR